MAYQRSNKKLKQDQEMKFTKPWLTHVFWRSVLFGSINIIRGIFLVIDSCSIAHGGGDLAGLRAKVTKVILYCY